jgi:Zn-dependent membrane protease YugP
MCVLFCLDGFLKLLVAHTVYKAAGFGSNIVNLLVLGGLDSKISVENLKSIDLSLFCCWVLFSLVFL